MCTPDLLGTQGTFLLFSTRPGGEKFKEGGARFSLRQNGDGYEGTIEDGDIFITNDPYSVDGAISHLNDWLMMMHRDVPLSSWSASGDDVVLDFDQRN